MPCPGLILDSRGSLRGCGAGEGQRPLELDRSAAAEQDEPGREGEKQRPASNLLYLRANGYGVRRACVNTAALGREKRK